MIFCINHSNKVAVLNINFGGVISVNICNECVDALNATEGDDIFLSVGPVIMVN